MPSMLLRKPLRSTSVLRALALCTFALLSIGPANAATRTVSNCNDSGPGSLRNVVANALSGDTINLASLGCSRILLTGRAIQVPQDDLEIVGRHRDALTIDGVRNARVFKHTGIGTLRLRRISIANGYLVGSSVSGGCIYSLGGVELIGSRLHHCELRAQGGLKPAGAGGGIFAKRVLLSYSNAYSNVVESRFFGNGGAVTADDIVLYHSQVHGNRASGGGGVFGSRVTATYSVISGNEGRGIDMPSAGDGCGPPAGCTLTLNKSTVSANRGGGIWALDADDVAIIESTVSDNVAWNGSAAVLPSGGETRIFNSTIAFNQDQPTGPSAECRGAIEAFGLLRLESSIVASNTCSLGDDNDIGDPLQGARIVGGNNIIGNSDLPVPPDTISARPRLGPLANNGGPTPTRKPHADSPALDRGSNVLNRQYDQRGPGFPRVKGGFPDIGAVER